MSPADGASPARARTVRDPLWGNIRLEPLAAEVVDTPAFQRLRRVKQLGFGHFVYPGAVHTRFLHALGVYHLCRRTISMLEQEGALDVLSHRERAELPLVRLAALLHDVGHYAFSHAMEEVEKGRIPGEHEEMAARFLRAPSIRGALERVHPEGPDRVGRFIRGESGHPLQGLVAGSLDLDKIDYLRRDAFFCGVPYGTVDVDRLLDSLTLARPGPGSPAELAVIEKGSAALESLLFAKVQMYRNVYWHHAVRAATVCFRRLVEGALAEGLLEREELPGRTDEELLGLLGSRADVADAELVRRRVDALVDRRLPKRCIELHGHELPDGVGSWLGTHPELVRRLEARLAREWGLREGAVYVDYPAYPRMLELEMLLVRRTGEVQRLTSSGQKGLIDLPRLGRSLYHTARVFRVFTGERIAARDPGPLVELLDAGADRVTERLESSRPLY